MSQFPVGSDLAEFRTTADGIVLRCVACGETLGVVHYLNNALVLWEQHTEEFRIKRTK